VTGGTEFGAGIKKSETVSFGFVREVFVRQEKLLIVLSANLSPG